MGVLLKLVGWVVEGVAEDSALEAALRLALVAMPHRGARVEAQTDLSEVRFCPLDMARPALDAFVVPRFPLEKGHLRHERRSGSGSERGVLPVLQCVE
jgi:hypothetical protein